MVDIETKLIGKKLRRWSAIACYRAWRFRTPIIMTIEPHTIRWLDCPLLILRCSNLLSETLLRCQSRKNLFVKEDIGFCVHALRVVVRLCYHNGSVEFVENHYTVTPVAIHGRAQIV